MTTARTLARLGALLTTGGLVALVGAAPASAHVSVDPANAAGGGSPVITFRVPDESATAGTVRLEVTVPTDRPITSVRTAPMPGWTAQVVKAPLPAPVDLGEGRTATEAVRSVTWTAQPGVRINPGEFGEFRVQAGPLPGSGTVVLPATQTYDDGRAVAWSDPPAAPGAPEPEHPAPALTLAASSGGMSGMDGMGGSGSSAPTSAGSGDATARGLGGAGLVLGAVGAALGVVALSRSRRRPTGSTTSERATSGVGGR